MIIDTVNRAISLLKGWGPHSCPKCVARGDTHYVTGPLVGRDVIQDDYPNWHDDTHWPVLLREMLAVKDFILTATKNGLVVHEPNAPSGTAYDGSEDIATAVCFAWLKWKMLAKETPDETALLTYFSDDMKGKYVKHVSPEDGFENE